MPKPKNFRGKKRQKGGTGGGTTPPPPPPGSAEKKSTIDRIVEFARIDEDANARAVYPAIIGKQGSITDLAIANVGQMELTKQAVAAALIARIGETDDEWGVRSTLIEVVPGSKVEVDVPKCRKPWRFYAKANVDAVISIIAAPIPLPSDTTGIGVAVAVHALVFGPNARASIQLADSKARMRGGGSSSLSSTIWYETNDEEALKKALRDMFRPSWIDLPLLENALETEVPDGWNKASSRRLRGLLTLMTRSMLPAKKALGFVGEGKSVVVGALTAAEVGMKKARRTSPPPVHPDGLPHFWFGELRRLGLDNIAVPLIKLR